jgi:hypothetical protein
MRWTIPLLALVGACATPSPAVPDPSPPKDPTAVRRILCGDADAGTPRLSREELGCGDVLLQQDGPVAAIVRWRSALRLAQDVSEQCAAVQRIKHNSMSLDADLSDATPLVIQRCGELAAEEGRAAASKNQHDASAAACRAQCHSQRETCVASAEGLMILTCDGAEKDCAAGCR